MNNFGVGSADGFKKLKIIAAGNTYIIHHSSFILHHSIIAYQK